MNSRLKILSGIYRLSARKNNENAKNPRYRDSKGRAKERKSKASRRKEESEKA
jgi:hypothetical protein